ncbi:tetratricopeptide repeat protein 5 [Apteryx rowi]|uniref:tetratricopeptide repeat protein 5 n=1 Tax=Apteryx rowi TaxID=308060 RepID=UPI000E1D3317|nr:tetratricopeptide repeat protein 5 [Apteryx rowi]
MMVGMMMASMVVGTMAAMVVGTMVAIMMVASMAVDTMVAAMAAGKMAAAMVGSTMVAAMMVGTMMAAMVAGKMAAAMTGQELVAELYRFRDGLRRAPGGDGNRGDNGDPGDTRDGDTRDGDHGDHGDPGDGDRGALEEEMEKTLRRMDEVQVSARSRGRALVLRARALSALPGDPRAEAALGRAVKLAPALPEAWTRLGEARWRRGDLEAARECFAGALRHGPDKEALRCLSMALRQAGRDAGAVRESVEHAKAAVRLDPADGRSWCESRRRHACPWRVLPGAEPFPGVSMRIGSLACVGVCWRVLVCAERLPGVCMCAGMSLACVGLCWRVLSLFPVCVCALGGPWRVLACAGVFGSPLVHVGARQGTWGGP